VDKRVSSAEIRETRDLTDITELEWIVVLDNETKSGACAWRKVPMESSSSPKVFLWRDVWRDVITGSSHAGARASDVL
jgi:hypothetical protein